MNVASFCSDLHRARDPRGLVALVLGVVADDAVAGAELAPQLLVLAARVVGDDRVGGVEDGLRAAVVLVEHDRGDVVERLLELRDVARSAPRKRYTLWSWSPTIVICSCSAASARAISFCAMLVSWYSSMSTCWNRCW